MIADGKGWVFTYNGENRLNKAENAQTQLQFAYDYMGRRFDKKVYEGLNLVKHDRFVYDEFKLIAIFDAASTRTHAFTWQPTDLDVPVSLTSDGQTYYYIVDGNKNVTGLADAAGNRLATYTYGPFGQTLTATGSMAQDNPFRFSSEYHDDETGLVYYNYRYYSPELGRWTKRDSIGERGGVNMYVINSNNNIKYRDLLGLNSEYDNKIDQDCFRKGLSMEVTKLISNSSKYYNNSETRQYQQRINKIANVALTFLKKKQVIIVGLFDVPIYNSRTNELIHNYPQVKTSHDVDLNTLDDGLYVRSQGYWNKMFDSWTERIYLVADCTKEGYNKAMSNPEDFIICGCCSIPKKNITVLMHEALHAYNKGKFNVNRQAPIEEELDAFYLENLVNEVLGYDKNYQKPNTSGYPYSNPNYQNVW